MKIIHFIPGLGNGGAEHMLYNIIKNKQNQSIEYSVVTLGMGDYYIANLQAKGVEVIVCEIKKNPIKAIKSLLKEFHTVDILCCWMYHCNLLGLILGRLSGVNRIIWCIRHSDLSKKNNKKRTLFINYICSKLSKYVDNISYNGHKSRGVHEERGYLKENGRCINNGCDTGIYFKINNARDSLEKELGCSFSNKKIVLSVCRYHTIKDIPNFVESFKKVHELDGNTVAIMCGNGLVYENKELINLILSKELKLREDVILLGIRNDLSFVMSACDVYVLHSLSEAFPNVLIEAMACEAVCISTNVGDVNRILEDEKYVVEIADSSQLSTKIKEMINLESVEKKHIGINNRNRIVENFNIINTVIQYEKFFIEG